MRNKYFRIWYLVFFLAVSWNLHAQNKEALFIAGLDSVREDLKIPGMAMALKEENRIVVKKGFGYADIRNKIKVTPATSFRVASITKTFTSTLIMQLVEKGKLSLQDPVSKYGLDFGNPSITVGNLLTHTSEGIPGSHYQYNGYRYGQLTPVIEKVSGLPFYRLLMEQIVLPLQMKSTAPGISLASYYNYMHDRKDVHPYFDNAFSKLAKPYGLDNKGNIFETTYFDEFGAFGGLTTTVEDLLKYSAAIDQHRFVSEATQKLIFTPNGLSDGSASPYGLGWFSQQWLGVDYYWHYGQTQGESGLFIKVPARKLTLAVITNSIRLSAPFSLADGDLFMSPVAQLLFKYIINRDPNFQAINYRLPVNVIESKLTGADKYREFYNKEMIVQATLCIGRGDTVRARELYSLYAKINFKKEKQVTRGIIAEIKDAGIDVSLSKNFSLTEPTKIQIDGAGENCSTDLSSWCDYGWIEDNTGKILWQMQGQPATHAGGAIKNQRVTAEITLPAGAYILKYKSDSGHAFNNWDSLPPDDFFWGIILYKDDGQ